MLIYILNDIRKEELSFQNSTLIRTGSIFWKGELEHVENKNKVLPINGKERHERFVDKISVNARNGFTLMAFR